MISQAVGGVGGRLARKRSPIRSPHPTHPPSASGLTGSTPHAGTATTYDPATAEATQLASTDAFGNATATHTATAYDRWGRVTGWTDEAGAVTTTSYVAPGGPGAGQTLTVADAKTTSTFGYGTDALGRTDRRGNPTSLSVNGSVPMPSHRSGSLPGRGPRYR